MASLAATDSHDRASAHGAPRRPRPPAGDAKVIESVCTLQVVMAYIVMSYVVMAYVVMAYIAMAYIFMVYIFMACVAMAHIVMAYAVMAYIVMAEVIESVCTLQGNVAAVTCCCFSPDGHTLLSGYGLYLPAYIGIAYIGMAYIVIAYVVMAYIGTIPIQVV